jgi:hypothetical protein
MYKITFQGFDLKVKSFTNIFVKVTIVWSSRSRILIPPLTKGNIALSHVTFAFAFPFAWLDQTKFLIKFFTFFTTKSDKFTHEATYHTYARIIWFATEILAANDNFLDIIQLVFPSLIAKPWYLFLFATYCN